MTMPKQLADVLKSETDELIALAEGITTAQQEAQTGFSNAQELFAKRCAAIAIGHKHGAEWEAVCAGIPGPKGPDGKVPRKQKATDARHWGDPKIAPKIDTVFNEATKQSGGKSVYGFAYKIGTLLKDGTTTSCKAAAQAIVKAATDKAADAKTPDGAKKKAAESAQRLLKAAGYQPEDIAPVLAAIEAMGAPSVKAEPVVTAEPEPVDATPADVTDAQADEELGAILAGLQQGMQAMAGSLAALTERK
jgi:hypothetical protein